MLPPRLGVIRLGSQGGLPDLWHRRRGPAQLAHLELPLLDLLRQFDPADHHFRRCEALQPQLNCCSEFGCKSCQKLRFRAFFAHLANLEINNLRGIKSLRTNESLFLRYFGLVVTAGLPFLASGYGESQGTALFHANHGRIDAAHRLEEAERKHCRCRGNRYILLAIDSIRNR